MFHMGNPTQTALGEQTAFQDGVSVTYRTVIMVSAVK